MSTSSASTMTSSRARLRLPGGTLSPRWRIPTNALAHSTSVVATAASGSQVRVGWVGAGAVVVVTGQDYGRP